MGMTCQHCGTRYEASKDQNGFCCTGCAQVYRLIQDEGLGDFYNLQDRIGQPPVDQPDEQSERWVRLLQADAEAKSESPLLVLAVAGMTCAGCAWLIEKLGSAHTGVDSVRVELESNTVLIKWVSPDFVLADLTNEWRRYGYQTQEFEKSRIPALSPLLWRAALCVLFAMNGWFLSSLPALGLDVSAFEDLFKLLEWLFVGITLLVGASFFMVPVYQSLRLTRLHYDALPAAGLSIALLHSLIGDGAPQLWFISLLIAALLLIRWGHRDQWRRERVVAASVSKSSVRLLQCFVGVALLLGGIGLFFNGALACVAMLLSVSAFPFARSVSAQPKVPFAILVLVFASVGIGLGFGFGSPVLALMWSALSGAVCNFLFFHSRIFSDRSDERTIE